MKKLFSCLWLSLAIGTTAHVLTVKNGVEKEMESELLRSLQYSCILPNVSHPASSSVHTLRPSDIKAIAAVGSLGNIEDSGVELTSLLRSTEKDLIQASMETLTALVSRFNPSVQLFPSLGNSRAVSKMEAMGLLAQAKEVVKSLQESQSIDYHNDWKLITVFHPCPFQASISQVQLRDAQHPWEAVSQHNISPLDSIKKLEDVLDFLYEEVPKSFVNLVDSALLTVLSLPHKDQNSIRESPLEPCLCFNDCSRLEDIIGRWSYQDALEKLLMSMKYNLKGDFTVVLQTSLQEVNKAPSSVKWANVNSAKKTPLENPGKEFAALGVAIWNNMYIILSVFDDWPQSVQVQMANKILSECKNPKMNPVGQKQPYHFAEIPKAQCPSQEHPYFFTYKNSNYSSFPPESQAEAVSEQRSFGTSVPCSSRDPSNTIPVSVHNLRPADIKVIGALGDSITAGNGAGSSPLNVLDVLTQYRGLSWSVGGNENLSTVTTLANILREFNPSLLGFSTGKGSQDKSNAYLNQAVAGARSELLSFNKDAKKQEKVQKTATDIIDIINNECPISGQKAYRLDEDRFCPSVAHVASTGGVLSCEVLLKKINFQEDWKLLTLFIGGNDLCRYCEDPERFSPENFTSNIQTALDILHKEVPRMFVNLVTILHITTLRKLYQDKRVYCPRVLMRSLCPCVLNPDDNSIEIEMLESFNRRYQEETHRLVNSGRYDTREDFTVVVQPFLEDTSMPETQDGLPDSSFFAPDCFHFQQKSHSQAARALWNNMLEPLGNKTKAQALEDEIILKCPTQEQPYLMTYRNSNYTYFSEATLAYGSQMLCEDRAPSSTYPVSVHRLKPADVQVIAALGDSFTAGNGIGSNPNDMWNMNTQYRGLAWSIGGDGSLTNVTTLSNIFREFNAKLTGYSTGTGGPSEPNAFFNQAVPGAQAKDLPEQVKHLVKLMKNDSRIRFDSDWKVITIFIGTYDLCNYCKDINHYSAINFSNYIREALDILHSGVPNAFVNLVEVMDLLPLRQLFLDSRLPCPAHLAEDHCSCVLSMNGNSSEQMMQEAVKEYQSSLQKLVETGRYNSQENFTVVLQPFLRTIILPLLQDGRPDISFFAPDCFHLSQKSHSKFSRALWNNMLQPVGEKAISFNFMENFTLSCPTLHQSFLGTYKNKNGTHWEPNQNWGSDLSCPGQTISRGIPTSVHELRPADIQVVAALGDSFTTAIGAQATGLKDLETAWRGLSWSAGSDGNLETHTTLPNILKKFNSNLFGSSTGTQKETAGFNMAAEGATAQNLSAQARELVDLMKSSSDINYEEDWKLVTIFIGYTDLCQYCLNKEIYSVEKYVKHLQDTLDILYKELPRAFINMVEIMELTGLRRIERETSGCVLSGASLCPCFLNPQENSPELQEMEMINRDYQDRSTMMINSGRYAQRNDFAVVVQPFFRNTFMPLDSNGKPDLSYFAVDCFHFSEKGYAEMAMALWNNMLEPVGHKQSYNNFTYDRLKLKCPTSEHPYLFTSRNNEGQSSGIGAESSGDVVPYWVVIVAATAGILAGSLIVWIWKTQKISKHPWAGDIATEEKSTAF